MISNPDLLSVQEDVEDILLTAVTLHCVNEMSAPWAPDAAVLGQVVHMLQCSLAPDTKLQLEATKAMVLHRSNPEFSRYLLVVFSRGVQLGLPSSVRLAAGLALKRGVDSSFSSMAPDAQALLKSEIVPCLADADADVRRTAANVASTIVRDSDLPSWRELPGALHAAMVSGNRDALVGSLQCLEFLSADVANQFDSVVLGNPLDAIVPVLIQCMRHPELQPRTAAAKCMSNFLFCRSTAVSVNSQAYLAALAALTVDPSPDVRETVSVSLSTLAESNLALIWPQMGSVMEYQLNCLAARESAVVIAAANFWIILAEQSDESSQSVEVKAALTAALPRLVPALLGRMVLTEDDIAAIQSLESDKPEDVRPHIYRSRPAISAAASQASAAAAENPASESSISQDPRFPSIDRS
jgi:hypothetical protein